MATVHLGRMRGPAGFGKTVAVKRLHAQFAKDVEFAKMFLDEARVTSGLTHPNVVMTLDVLEEPDGLYLVMEYVHGVSLAQIERALPPGEKMPMRIACAVAAGFLEGLHAAHEATDDGGQPLGIVHRDVSPQNVLVTFAGVPKIADFGIAKAAGNMHSTGDGSAKGKLSYMAPEQVMSDPVTPRTDVFAAGIVLWECLTRRRLVEGGSAAERLRALLDLEVPAPSTVAHDVPLALDAIVLRALAKDPAKRFASASEMAAALQGAVDLARAGEIAEWTRRTCAGLLAQRDRALGDLQRMSTGSFEAARMPAPPRPTAPTAIADTSTNVTINDYLTRSERNAVPHRMPRAVLAALIALPLLGLTGTVLVFVSLGRSRAPAAEATLPASAITAAPAPPPPPPPAAPSESAPPPLAEPSATIAEAPATKPRTTKPATATKKCRIVATPDKSGRMKFEEVCGP
jgi:serine/threonine-protein kinase